ncbi:NAD(P)-binding protein [Aspergillus sclerotioniger CBS 115572]|uniref:NAD(P)-binding protein n=1 Tax=Aspergillus sclerotioniger CBS 115572 TaxID=1450535 RepID=A0A317WL16_9EURO|nr:NAD(P)-binding protein [Aspergillus sclerotioniger CBS 115572]PWY86401.1 NAD(P)-binding protein [Aspergillus sclerotioniger CBS 115572]
MANNISQERVLITGATGYIGFQTLVLALQRGYSVRAVVRKEASIAELSRAPIIANSLDQGQLEIVVIPDFLKKDAFIGHLDGITSIIHLASPLGFSTDDFVEGIIKPAVSMVTAVLEAATHVQSVRRVVVTSSCVTLIPFEWNMNPDTERLYSVSDINNSVDGPYENAMAAYWASKGLARLAVRDFVRNSQPQFDFVNLLPSVVIGPDTRLDYNPAAGTSDLLQGAKSSVIAAALTPSLNSSFPYVGTPVHVADVARAHVDALDTKLVPANSEYVLSSDTPDGVVWDRDVRNICRKYFPEEVARKVLPMEGSLQAITWRLDAQETEKVFGWQCVSFEETMKELISQYLRLHARQA